MAEVKSGARVTIIVAVITVLGSLIVALINKWDFTSKPKIDVTSNSIKADTLSSKVFPDTSKVVIVPSSSIPLDSSEPSLKKMMFTVSKNGDGDYRSIQEAINNASDKSTIIIKPGRYLETVRIKSGSYVFKGDSEKDKIIIDKIWADRQCDLDITNVTIKNTLLCGRNLILQNSTIYGEDVALQLGAGSSEIRNCEISAFSQSENLSSLPGVGVHAGQNVYMEQCTISNCKSAGLLVGGDEHVELSKCKFTNNGVAIYLLGVGKQTVIENECVYEGNGLRFTKSSNSEGTINGRKID